MNTLSSILDQSDAVEWLRKAYAADRLPHGLIFAGPAGVGKGTTARALAALWLCERPKADPPDACGQCASCKLMAAETHPDFGVVYRQLVRTLEDKKDSKARDLSVDVIRRFLLEPAALKPVMNRGRVFVVEEAETMNAAAQNGLLKTLEEPYGRTLIILLADDALSMLQTIRSRSQVVRFGALSAKNVAAELAGRGIEKGTADRAAAIAEGSLGSALKWIEDGVVDAAGELARHVDDVTAGRGGAELPDWFKRAADAYAEKQVGRDKNTSLDQAKREGLGLYLKLTGQHFRRMLASGQGVERACESIEAIARADEHLEANVNIPVIFQQLAMTLGRVWKA
ncbi:MAG: hypothetical protein ACAI43_01150 [Phycisphaerae bacterium]|nr:DNA polymerase III subunit delta' [Tepidisphaeraceae bacterium]